MSADGTNMKQGICGIGIYQGKNVINYGTLFRTALIFNADFLFIIGRRFKPQSSDTVASYRHLPTYSYRDYEEFNNNRPFDCQLIGIEICDKAIDLASYKHPKRAIYLLGAEDSGLPTNIINKCKSILKLPGEHCLNVSVAGSIVLYDRLSKGAKD
jgi:tRNA G18 (ribose-2'-O)-methylase SpoU